MKVSQMMEMLQHLDPEAVLVTKHNECYYPIAFAPCIFHAEQLKKDLYRVYHKPYAANTISVVPSFSSVMDGNRLCIMPDCLNEKDLGIFCDYHRTHRNNNESK